MKTKFTLRVFILTALFVTAFSLNKMYAQALPRPDHIVILIEENQPNFLVIGNTVAPYINALAADTDAAVFTQMYALEHPSQPDYLDFFGGNNQGVLDDNLPTNYPYTTPNLARELLDAGRTFITYSQFLPSTGSDIVSVNGYARKHNPVTNWVGTGTNQVPDTLNQSWDNFPTDFNLLPTISYVVPNEDSDMHNGFGNPPIAAGDYWMARHLDDYIQWARTHNSLFIYTFDEDDGFANNNIPTIFFGPMVKGGSYTNNYNLYNILRTLEDMYGTGYAGAAATSIPILNCWRSAVSTGVNNMGENGPIFQVYPNPASTLLQFDGAKLNDGTAEISITDVAGRIVSTYRLPESKKLEVNTADYPAGLYFYHLTQDTHSLQSGKFIITH